jgi:hypothetical protein
MMPQQSGREKQQTCLVANAGKRKSVLAARLCSRQRAAAPAAKRCRLKFDRELFCAVGCSGHRLAAAIAPLTWKHSDGLENTEDR